MVRQGSDRFLPLRAPVPAIAMGPKGAARGSRSRAETALRLLLRVIAVVWLIEGVQQWYGVLTGPNLPYLPAAAPLHVASLFFFCILDFVAAIGLWLVSSWGVAVWFATMLGHALAFVLAPGSLAEPVLLVLGDAVLASAYALLAWIVAREHHLA